MNDLQVLLDIAKRKSVFDQTNSWFNGSQTYLSEIKKEIDEVIEEVPKQRSCFLEDELGDVLWDYFNIVLALEKEADIDIHSVLARACRKYEERITTIENGGKWEDIKTQQKQRLLKEQNDLTQTEV